MAQTWVEKHEAIEVRVVRIEQSCFVQSMEVFDEGGDLQLMADPFYDSTEGISRCSRRKRKFRVAIRHAFGANEDKMNGGGWEQVAELYPGVTGKRRFGTCAKDEDTYWWSGRSKPFNV